MKIVALPKYGPLGASSRLRTYQYLDRLRCAGHDVCVLPLFSDDYVGALYGGGRRWREALRGYFSRAISAIRLNRFDICWVEKEMLPWVPWFFERIFYPANCRLVVDYDDAIFHNYDLNRGLIVRSLLATKIDRVMSRADLVIAGNRYLAERAHAAGCRKVEIVPTVVDLQRYPLTARSSGAQSVSRELTVGWIGSPSTAKYLPMLFGVAARLSDRFGVRFVAVGARPDQVAGSAFEAVEWREDREVDQVASFDIGVMPLFDGPWEKGKCGYKLVQYMACGVPSVASDVGVNREILAHGTYGMLAKSENEWEARIASLIASPSLRNEIGMLGRARVERDFNLARSASRIEEVLEGLI